MPKTPGIWPKIPLRGIIGQMFHAALAGENDQNYHPAQFYKYKVCSKGVENESRSLM
jgi:hypothetical protein